MKWWKKERKKKRHTERKKEKKRKKRKERKKEKDRERRKLFIRKRTPGEQKIPQGVPGWDSGDFGSGGGEAGVEPAAGRHETSMKRRPEGVTRRVQGMTTQPKTRLVREKEGFLWSLDSPTDWQCRRVYVGNQVASESVGSKRDALNSSIFIEWRWPQVLF